MKTKVIEFLGRDGHICYTGGSEEYINAVKTQIKQVIRVTDIEHDREYRHSLKSLEEGELIEVFKSRLDKDLLDHPN